MKSYHKATSILNTLIKHDGINKSLSLHFIDTQNHIVTQWGLQSCTHHSPEFFSDMWHVWDKVLVLKLDANYIHSSYIVTINQDFNNNAKGHWLSDKCITSQSCSDFGFQIAVAWCRFKISSLLSFFNTDLSWSSHQKVLKGLKT